MMASATGRPGPMALTDAEPFPDRRRRDPRHAMPSLPVPPAVTAQPFKVAAPITFFYREARLKLLFETLRSLQTLDVALVEARIFTDTSERAHLDRMSRLFGKLTGPRFAVTISTHPEVAPRPRLLPWAHKPWIRELHERRPDITHVVYLEEDIQFNDTNFKYFLIARDLLRGHGLIPGYARFEYNETEHDIFNADQHGQQDFGRYPVIRTAMGHFVALEVPYAAMFVLDRALAAEYIASPSFSLDGSESRVPWGEPERAAMGLTWENVPAGYRHRLVVPLTPRTGTPNSSCWVYHSANNYTNDYRPGPNFILGKTRMDEIFVPETMTSFKEPRAPNWTRETS